MSSSEIGMGSNGGNSAPVQVVVHGSSSSSLSTSMSATKHLMEEFRTTIRDRQRVESLISQAGNHPLEVWRKALLWATASGQTAFLSHFLQRTPPNLRDLLKNAQDSDNFTALHRAVVAGQVKIVDIIMTNAQYEQSEIFDILHARTPDGWTSLHLAVATGDEEMITALTKFYETITLPRETEWDFADNFWMTPLHYAVLGKLPAIVTQLLDWQIFDRHVNAHDYYFRTAAHMASSDTGTPMEPLATSSKVDLNAVDCCLYTPLHWGVFVGATDAVRCLISQASERTIRTTENDIDGWPVLRIAMESTTIDRKVGKDLEKLLLTSSEVKDDVERLYRDRQVYVDAANAILVGAALISSVTFGGFLQKPFTPDEHTPRQRDRVFWAFNSLSFFFSIATVMAGAGAVLPMEDVYIGETVGNIRVALGLTSFLLIVSVVFVLGAFGASGFSAGIPGLEQNMIVTFSIGGSVCAIVLAWFFFKLYQVRPNWRRLVERATGIWHYTMMKKGPRDYVQIQTELNGAEQSARDELRKKHIVSKLETNRQIDLTDMVLELEKASRIETHVRQHAKDPVQFIHDDRDTVLEKRITPFEEAYEKARLKRPGRGRQQDPTLNVLILNHLGPRGVHNWVQPFSSSYCRRHCLKKDGERWSRIRDTVLARKKPNLENECNDFEFGNLSYDEWVPT